MLKILYYNHEEIDPQIVLGIYEKLYNKFQGEVIALPMETELICNSPLDQLYNLRNMIDKAIYEKEHSTDSLPENEF